MKIIKIPFSGGGLKNGAGANEAPDNIIKQLKDMFLTESAKQLNFKFEDVSVDEYNISESHKNIENTIKKLKEKAIIVGGDHSITHPCVKGFSKNVKDFKFIVFDAHPDLMDDFRPPTHEDYLKVLIEEKIVNPEDVLLIGIRNWDVEEFRYIKENKIKFYTCENIFEKGIKMIVEEIISWIDKPIYLSVDIDVVDPVEAIGTGYLEHGGISSRELIYFLQKIKETKYIKSCDIVEVNPKKDVKNITSKLAAKLIVELSDF